MLPEVRRRPTAARHADVTPPGAEGSARATPERRPPPRHRLSSIASQPSAARCAPFPALRAGGARLALRRSNKPMCRPFGITRLILLASCDGGARVGRPKAYVSSLAFDADEAGRGAARRLRRRAARRWRRSPAATAVGAGRR
jgi:hypothetical protein